MALTLDTLTPEHLGEGATNATVSQFLRACDVEIRREAFADTLRRHPDGSVDWDRIVDAVWHDGDFAPRIRELLGEEVVR